MTIGLALSARDRRTLAMGAGAITALLSVARGLPALRSWNAAQRSYASQTARELRALQEGMAALPALRDSLAARRRRLSALDSEMLAGASIAELSAAVATRIEAMADEHSLKVTALQLRSDSVPIDGLARAHVRLTAVADVEGFAGFLRGIEGGAAPLVVEELGVSQPDPAADSLKPEMLRVDLLVAALGAVASEHRAPSSGESGARGSTTDSPTTDLDSVADAIVANDMFRLANAPASVRYDPNGERRGTATAASPRPAPVRPIMTLRAIVGGPPWQAVVDGIPGRAPGTIVRAGSEFDRLVARRVTRDSVIIQGPDTTWVLTFQRRQ